MHRGLHAIAGTARTARTARLNHAVFAWPLGGEWAGQGSNLRPWEQWADWVPAHGWAAGVVTENDRYVRYAKRGGVPVRSRSTQESLFAGCFESSRGYSSAGASPKWLRLAGQQGTAGR